MRIQLFKLIQNQFIFLQPRFYFSLLIILSSNQQISIMSEHPQKQFKKQIGLIRYYKIQRMIKKWRKQVKNSRHRHNVLKEWIQTEQNYVNDLTVIIEKIQAPMMKKKVINQDQQSILFPNLDVIIKLSLRLLEFLKTIESEWHPLNTQISPELMTLYPFFKIYISYCNVFYKGQNILKDLKNNLALKEIQKNLPMDMASYLIKPIQRPPKYMLLLRDYQKHMNKIHKDYTNLTQTIQKYHLVNEINNEAIAKQGRAEKMFYLQKLSGGLLLTSSRQFLGECQAYFGEQLVVVYRLNDMIIISSCLQSKQNVLKKIYLDGSSNVEIIPDGKYFFNYVLVCGKTDCVHLSFVNKQEQSVFFQNMNLIINKLLQKENERKKRMDKKFKPQVKVRVTLASGRIQFHSKPLQLKIVVSGAQKRPLSSIKNDTIYIVKFHLPKPWSLAQYIFLRYSVIQQIQSYARKKYSDIELPKLRPTDMGSYEQTKNSTKIIEFRKMAITQFLNVIFRNQNIMSNPLFLIQKLIIEQNFWSYAIEDNKQQQCFCQLCLKQEEFTVDKFFKQKAYYMHNYGKIPKQKFCMKKYMNDSKHLLQANMGQINTFSRILTWIYYSQGRIDYSKIYKKSKNDKGSDTIIKIWLPNVADEFIEFKIDVQTTVGDVMLMVAKEYKIDCIDDFGLFLEYNGVPRLLDSDENISQVMILVQGDLVQQEPNGFLNKIHKWGTDLWHGKKSRIYLRKYLFLAKELEMDACNTNLERYILLVQQIFYDVKNNRINLSKEELVQISAYFVSMKSYSRLPYLKKSNFPKDTLSVLLPPNKQSLIQNNTWVSAVYQIISWNKDDICPPKPLTALYQKILRVVQNKQSYKCFWFSVTNYCPQTLRENLTEVLIGVNYQNFMVLNPKNLSILLTIPLLELKYRITIYSIFIDTFENKHRFDGRMLESLSKIIEKYKIYNGMFINFQFKKST